MVALFFGPPGVGKGTQSLLISQRMNFGHLSTGDAFRKAIGNETEVGLIAKGFVDAGALVPDEVVTRIVEEALAQPEYKNSIILDGFPRTTNQAEALDAILKKLEKSVSIVVNIEVPREQIIERLLKRGRKDDSREIIAHRFDVYQNETAPLLAFYKKNNVQIVNINGNGEVEEVFHRIQDAISSLQEA
jgi:adenylate kinase